jgi:flavodoxin I
MSKIGLYYGSETGNTENAAKLIAAELGTDLVDVHNVGNAAKEDMEQYEHLIMGIPTWYDGEVTGDWDTFFPALDEIDFNGKTIALFGLGDQIGYSEYFLDAMGILYDKLIERGATIVGRWPSNEYDFDESKAVRDDQFVGLALDEDNESGLTGKRIKEWVAQIKTEFGL